MTSETPIKNHNQNHRASQAGLIMEMLNQQPKSWANGAGKSWFPHQNHHIVLDVLGFPIAILDHQRNSWTGQLWHGFLSPSIYNIGNFSKQNWVVQSCGMPTNKQYFVQLFYFRVYLLPHWNVWICGLHEARSPITSWRICSTYINLYLIVCIILTPENPLSFFEGAQSKGAIQLWHDNRQKTRSTCVQKRQQKWEAKLQNGFIQWIQTKIIIKCTCLLLHKFCTQNNCLKGGFEHGTFSPETHRKFCLFFGHQQLGWEYKNCYSPVIKRDVLENHPLASMIFPAN